MQAKTAEVRDTLYRMQQALDADPALAARVGSARPHLDRVAAALSVLPTIHEETKKAATAATDELWRLAREIRDVHTRPIALIAKQRLGDAPEFQLMKMPKSPQPGTQLVGAARAMAIAARDHTTIFLEFGLPSDFVARLLAAADRLQAVLDERQRLKGVRTQATARLDEQTREGNCIIKIIDVLRRLPISPDAAASGASELETFIGREGDDPTTSVK